MNQEQQQALSQYLLAMADDELLLGHRNSEWCGYAPILEEDIAFANLALDEIGHAGLWYAVLADLLGEDPDTYPDQLVYLREPSDYRSLQLVELPPGDWAFTILRQYLFDVLEEVRLERLEESAYAPLAEAAAKVRKEEMYHLRHSRAWMRRLGQGTEESNQRLQTALESQWPYTWQPFIPLPGEDALVQAGFIPSTGRLQAAWEEQVLPFLEECALALPPGARLEHDRSQHSPHLKILLSEMQSLPRAEPGAEW